jgi:hypothetical protein
MKIQQTLIAVFVCFIVNLSVAEADSHKEAYKHRPGWHNELHHKWSNFRHRKWHLRWRYQLKAPKAFTSGGASTFASLSGMHHDFQNHDNGPKTPSTSGNGMGGTGHGSAHHVTAPEISVASGTSAIALLAGMLLLTGERTRSRRI